MKTLLLPAMAAALLACAAGPGFAGDEMFELDSHFRAKIAKEKVKTAARQRAMDASTKGVDNSQCGSQNIGSIETGRAGAAPREVFVFAPNAINIVTAGGCR